jgi:GAF domain-containing protein
MIKRFFESPEDQDPSFISLVRFILVFALTATVASAIAVAGSANSRALAITLAALVAAAVVESVALFYTLRNKVVMAKAVVPAALTLMITIIALSTNSIHDISVVAYPLIIVIATLLQGKRAIIVTLPLAVGAIILMGTLDMLGVTTAAVARKTGIDDIVAGCVLLVTTSGILNLMVSRLNRAVARAESNEKAQLEANQELKKLQVSLEQRVEDRTSELSQRGQELEDANKEIRKRAEQFEAIAQVTQSITSIRDLQELLPRIAKVISDTFDFYHVGVFMMDTTNEYAVLSATNSQGGRQMMQRGHRLRVGEQGIVGYVTATGTPRIAMDVGKDAVFFDNLELAETHSEMALPLTSGNRVIGALDVQSTKRGAFKEEDVQMLSLLANQVSLAIENARLFDETRRALAEAQSISRQTLREAWSKLPADQNIRGYRYTSTGASPLDKPVDLTETAEGETTVRSTESGRVVVPIELRGETIGTLVIQSPSSNVMDDDQMDLIRAVAERVAISAENARLFDETNRRAERERLVSDITGKIRSVNDPQSMIQTAMEELRKALGASRVEVVPQSVKGIAEASVKEEPWDS